MKYYWINKDAINFKYYRWTEYIDKDFYKLESTEF
jgi:hypothetical protein